MSSLIYGSTAAKYWWPEFREPRDFEQISTTCPQEGNDFIPAFKTIGGINTNDTYVDPNILYTIKVSHAAWDIKWVKTMKDIGFMQSKGCILLPHLFKALYADW